MTLEEKWISECLEIVVIRVVVDIYDFEMRSLFFVRRNSKTGPTSVVVPRRSFSRAYVTGLATLRTTTRIGCTMAESQREVPSVIRMQSCASPSGFSLATINCEGGVDRPSHHPG